MKFIEWWWTTKLGRDDRIGLSCMVLIGSSALAGILAGNFGIFLCGLAVSAVLVGAYFISMHFLNSWREYMELKEREAQAIVDKLSGRSSPQEILDRLRAKVGR